MKTLRCLILVLILVLPGCRDHKETIPQELADILNLGIDRPLEVVLASPQGETSGPEDFESVTIAFNQPMKALTTETPKLTQPFQLDPPTKGRFRWKGSATVSFEPEQPLKFGTEYTITVPKGIAAAGGSKLEKEAKFTFSTPGPRLVMSVPSNNSTGYKAENPIILGFDQTVDPKKVQALLRFSSPNGAPKPQVRELTDKEAEALNKDRAEPSRFIPRRSVAVLAPALKPGTRYTLKLEKGLTGENGPLPANKDATVTFTTLGPFVWTQQAQKEAESPSHSVDFHFSNAFQLKALKDHLKVEPKVEIPRSDYDESEEWESNSVYLPLEPNTTYTFTVDAGLTDVHGQKLEKDVVFTWKTGDRSPEAQIAEGLGVLEASGKLELPVGLQNIDKQTVRMSLLDSAEMMRLVAKDEYDWLWGAPKFTPEGGWDLVRSSVPDGPRNQVYDRPIDLKPALKGRPFGFIFYEVESVAGKTKFRHRGLLQVTNLAATGKFSPENSVFVATSLDQAEPLSGVEAVVVDGTGHPVWTGKSGSDGRVEAPGWSQLLGPTSELYQDPPMSLFLKKGKDQVFIRNGSFGSVSAWAFDIPIRWTNSAHTPTLKAYTERGLYLPGDEVQVKGALRDRAKGQWVTPDLKTLQFELFNSRDESIDKGTVALSDFGTFHQTLKIPPKSPTGSYRLDFSLPKDTAKSWRCEPELSGVSFRVEEFQPAQFKVEVTSSKKSAKMGDSVDVTVLGSWLFGSPMNEEKVTWSSSISPSSYSHKDYPGFDFGPLPLDNDEDSDRFQDLSDGLGLTNNKGEFKAEVPLKGIAYRGDGELFIEGTITSSNRRSITGQLLIPVARGAYRLGLKPTGRFVDSSSPVTIQTVALDLEGQPISGKSGTVELLRREWNSTRKTDVDGRFRWVTEIEDKSIEKKDFQSAKAVGELTLTPKEAGFYIVRATSVDDQKNTILAETSFYAQGSGRVPWGRSEGDTIELVPDKLHYNPGETARILIKSPFPEATALITYERDLILYSKTTKLTGNAPVIEVPLTEEHVPNVYVSVMLFRGRVSDVAEDSSEDAGRPAFKIGYLDLPVSPDEKRLKIDLKTDKPKYGPGDEVVTTMRVTDVQGKPVQAELSLTAADVGVLNLIDYQTPDFFDTFYGSLPLAVRTAESRLDVIGQRSYGTKGEAEGGGGGYNPGFRSDFRLTAVWKPQVVTDAQGTAEVRFRLPENLTTFRMMTTAITKDTRCGSAESEIILTKPLILKPSAPSFARLGDDFQAGVLAVNGTEEDSTLKVILETEGVPSAAEPREIFLKAGEEREILFPLKADKVGTATLRFSGQMGQHHDGLQVEIPLQEATQRVNLVTTGQTEETSFKQNLKIPETVVEGSAKLKVQLSSTMLNGLQASIDQLVDYPYGCLEQRLSRMTPLLFTDNLVARFGLQNWPKAKVKSTVQENLDLIPGYADSSGGLKIWPTSSGPQPYLTALAVRTAYLAQEKGYKTGPWLEKANAYLKKYLDGPGETVYGFNEAEVLTTKAAALEALTHSKTKGNSYLSGLMDRRSKMPAVGKALLLEAAHRLGDKKSADLLAQELSNSLKLENATAHFEVDKSLMPWLYSSDTRDTGVILGALLNTGHKLPVADKVVTWLLEARNSQGTWGTTSNNAAALSALWAFAEVFEGKDPTFSVSAKIEGGKDLGQADFAPGKTTQAQWESDLAKGESNVEVIKKGKGHLYYSLAVSYQDREPSPPVDEGMTVLRAITDLEGHAVEEIQGGEIYKIQLSVIAPAIRRYVVLEDPVPAGFEVVKTDFATESSKLTKLLERGSSAGWQTFIRFEDYADRVLLFADALAPGEHTYQYLVRAQTPGVYQHPAAQVEEMYHPELFGRTATTSVTIK